MATTPMVTCGWTDVAPEVAARFPDSVAFHAAHPTLGECDSWHCSCGNEWTTRSTKEAMRVEICSQCPPFFTGEQRIVDTAGRVERFKRRFGLE